LMVARTQVKLGEEASPVQLVEKLIDDQNQKLVFGCLSIEGMVVDAEALGVVRLAHQ
jgi:hypothetical protein